MYAMFGGATLFNQDIGNWDEWYGYVPNVLKR